jgi:hypothetical protein
VCLQSAVVGANNMLGSVSSMVHQVRDNISLPPNLNILSKVREKAESNLEVNNHSYQRQIAKLNKN